jgi:hypothetical protein
MSFGECSYPFEDLTVTIDVAGRRREAFMVSGVAAIEFSRDAEWWVAGVEIELAHFDGKGNIVRETVPCQQVFPDLQSLIERDLREQHADAIQERVNREFYGAGYILRVDPDNGDHYFVRRAAR